MRFQNDLAGGKPPGFIGATSFQIEAVPGSATCPVMKIGTYSTAPGLWTRSTRLPYLATFRRPHDGVAAMMEQGHGGLYAHAGGVEYAGAAFHYPLADAPARHSVAAGDRGGARQLSAGEGLAATDGFGTGGRVCRRNPRRSGDRRTGRLAASSRDARAPAARTSA